MVDTDPVDVTLASVCPIIVDMFQLVQPEYMDGIHEEMKATTCVLTKPLPLLAYKKQLEGDGPSGSEEW